MQKRLLRLQRAVRARFIDDVGQVLRQQFERRVDGEAEMAREFLHLGAAENSLELIFGDRKIGAGPEPGLDLGVEPALLQRGDETIKIAVLRLGQHRMDGSGQRRRFATVPRAPLSAPPRSRPSNKPMVASSTRLN